MPLHICWVRWVDLLVTPFRHLDIVWLGIVPLYVSLVLGELYKSKVTFGHAVANGFVMLWAGLNWGMRLSNHGWTSYVGDIAKHNMSMAWIVTATVIAIGVFTIVIGFRKADKKLCEILGHTRFSCYFLILLYPMQTMLPNSVWNSENLIAILLFALPAWLAIYLMGRLIRVMIK